MVSERLNRNCGFHYAAGALLHRHRSDGQLLEIFETPAFGRVLRVDGITLTSERDEFYYHENLVHVPAVAHRAPQNVLIIGGGDGGALEEVLKHACVRRVSLVEPEAALIEISIILDLPDPAGHSHALYTAEFYRLCRARLAHGGILALNVQSPVVRPHTFARIVATLRSTFAHVRPYLVYVPAYGTWLAMATASLDVDPIADSVEGMMSRFSERALDDLQYYNPATHFAAFALPNFVQDLLRQTVAPCASAV